MPKKKPAGTTTDSGIQTAARAHDFLAPVFSQYPLEVVSAQGVWLTNSRGERVLDLYGGHAVAALGYAHPGFTRALTTQAQFGSFHGRTAGAGAVTWGAQQKWYSYPRTPFDVSFIPRGNIDAIPGFVTKD